MTGTALSVGHDRLRIVVQDSDSWTTVDVALKTGHKDTLEVPSCLMGPWYSRKQWLLMLVCRRKHSHLEKPKGG